MLRIPPLHGCCEPAAHRYAYSSAAAGTKAAVVLKGVAVSAVLLFLLCCVFIHLGRTVSAVLRSEPAREMFKGVRKSGGECSLQWVRWV
jgi:hypothetical protein